LKIYFYEAVRRASELFATKHTALIVSILVSKNDYIFAIISKSASIPLVSPKPGESTMIKGGFDPQGYK
jgi:hypothetical protein